ncbi:NACHT domain-containing protein [Alkalinema pantanalense CENA528]|uniref:NACHT domain-containing protein n=1 Tax=Alkalinema pantanalense TaxID=1620705 RepID=UPI003D6E7779
MQAGGDIAAVQNSPDAQVIIQRSFISLFGNSPASPAVDWEWGLQILKQQQPDIKKRLRESLFGLAEVDAIEVKAIGQEDSPALALEAVKCLSVDGAEKGTIDPNAPLIATYAREDIEGKLLILGTPGAGKTITLLKLAEHLVGEAISNPKTVIPVIFELSTWRDGQEIGAWLIEQLCKNFDSKGDRNHRIYENWLKRRVLLPLMDGLDELGMVRQRACTEKINDFARVYPHLVVCCRVKEFQQAGVNLSNLRGTVQLQPLNDRQIAEYLQQMGKSGLWDQIQAVPEMGRLLDPVIDPENAEYDEPGLLRVPLFISLAAQVYEPDKPLKGKTDLFERYIDRQLSLKLRDADRNRKELKHRKWAFKRVQAEPDWRQTRQSLGWVARQLAKNNQIEFLVENIQPSCIENKREQWLYWFLLFGINLVVIGASIISILFYFINNYMKTFPLVDSLNSIIFWIFWFSIIASTGSKADTVRMFNALIYYSLNFLFKLKVPQYIRQHTPILHDLSLDSKIRSRLPSFPKGLKLKNLVSAYVETCRFFSALFLIPILPIILFFQNTVIFFSRIFGISKIFNQLEQEQKEIRNRIREDLIKIDYEKSPYKHSINLFIATLICTDYYTYRNKIKVVQICSVVLISPMVILVFLIMSLFNIGFIFTDNFRNPYEKLNQGRVEKLKLLILSIFFTVGFLIFQPYIPAYYQNPIPYWILNFLIYLFTLLTCIDLNKYFALRITLWQAKSIPWNLAQFLTYCHERRLLQQIGGRYRFIHRELLDHFAQHEA